MTKNHCKRIEIFVRLTTLFVLLFVLAGPFPARAGEPPAGGAAPEPRALDASTYDSTRHRMIMIGGATNERPENDVWALDLTPGAERWTKLAPAGTLPRARIWGHAIYDAPNDRVILYGGAIGSNLATNDTWALDLSTENGAWTQIQPATTGPARYGAAVVYDSVNQRMIVFGGGVGGSVSSQVWSFSLTPGGEDWRQLRPGGEGSPGQRQVTAAYDPANQRMVFYSGFGGARGFFNIDTWALDLSTEEGTWTRIQPSGLSPIWRVWHSTVYDDANKRMLIYGGIGFPAILPEKPDAFNLNTSQAAWTTLDPAGDAKPGPRILSTAIFDSDNQRMILYGGGQEGKGPTGDLWAMGGAPQAEAWSPILPSAVPISGRYGPLTFLLDEQSFRLTAGGITLEAWGEETQTN